MTTSTLETPVVPVEIEPGEEVQVTTTVKKHSKKLSKAARNDLAWYKKAAKSAKKAVKKAKRGFRKALRWLRDRAVKAYKWAMKMAKAGKNKVVAAAATSWAWSTNAAVSSWHWLIGAGNWTWGYVAPKVMWISTPVLAVLGGITGMSVASIFGTSLVIALLFGMVVFALINQSRTRVIKRKTKVIYAKDPNEKRGAPYILTEDDPQPEHALKIAHRINALQTERNLRKNLSKRQASIYMGRFYLLRARIAQGNLTPDELFEEYKAELEKNGEWDPAMAPGLGQGIRLEQEWLDNAGNITDVEAMQYSTS